MASRSMNEPGAPLPLLTWSGTVLPEWVDYNRHLRDAFYLLMFSLASDGFMDLIGLDADGRARTGHTMYTLEAHLNFLQQVKEGDLVEVRSQVLGADAKRLHLYQGLYRAGHDELLAGNELMLINVDIETQRAAAFAPAVRTRLAAITQAHATLDWPRYAGRVIALPA